MPRQFIRDRGTQVTLAAFVGTFVYAALGSSRSVPGTDPTSSRASRSR
jgi:uncharacterized membrane protein